MKNSEESAFGYGLANNSGFKEVKGLTKREYFAAIAMQGMLSNSNQAMVYADIDIKIKDCINHADELLKQLDNGH